MHPPFWRNYNKRGEKPLKYFKKIVGERLCLSPINIEGVEKYTEWVNDLSITINLSLSPYIFSRVSTEKIG